MKYRWTTCPNCRCEIAINYTDSPSMLFGSVRRWSRDRTINDGKPFRISPGRPVESGFSVDCPCGQALEVPPHPDAVSAEREENLRVTLGEEGPKV